MVYGKVSFAVGRFFFVGLLAPARSVRFVVFALRAIAYTFRIEGIFVYYILVH